MTDRLLGLAGRVENGLRRPAALALLLALLALYGAKHVSRGMGDFRVYRLAAERALAFESVHRLEDPHRYLYAPVVTLVFLPLAVVPPLAGKILWFVLNLLVVISIVDLSARLLYPEGRAPPGFRVLVVLLGSRFVDNNLGHGQMNLILLWLVLAAYVAAARGRAALAGLALAAAIATKIVPVVFLGQLVLRRQWRFAAATVGALVGLMLVPALWWGGDYPDVLRQWVAVVRDQAGHYEIGNKINQSISAFPYRLFRPHPGGWPVLELPAAVVTVATVAIHLAFLAPLAWLSLRRSADDRAPAHGPGGDELALYLLYSTVASPYSWKYYYANLFFPFAVCVARLWGAERDRFARTLVAAFLLNFLPGFRGFGKTLGLVFQLASLHFLSVVMLFWAIARSAAAQPVAGRERDFSSSGLSG